MGFLKGALGGPIGMGIAGGAELITGLIGSHQQSQGVDKQLAFERDLETRRRQEYDQQQQLLKSQWDAEQARRAPYRNLANIILQQKSAQYGTPFGQVQPKPYQPPAYDPQSLGGLAGVK